MKRTLRVIAVLVAVIAVLFIAALCAYFGATADVRLDRNKLTLDTSSVRLFDKNGDEIVCAKKQTATSFSELPPYLSRAFVAVEDKHFYTHNGFDFKRICKAALKNISSFSFREGASTISQQLIKNTHLSSEKTLNRKLKELKLTRILEKNYTKNEIMELYLNSIYFGHSAFGITDASSYYFGKETHRLTCAESAMLAALVRSPNRYSPFKDPEKCLNRRNTVLSLMKEQGFLSQEQYESALQEPLPLAPHETHSNAYLSRVYEELEEILGESGRRTLSVNTFYDPQLQSELEKNTAESDLCIAVRDNKSDALTALYSTCGTPKRLPASTIKPLLVYAPALEENLISPLTPLLDERTDFGGYNPDDYGGASGKYMSARYALAHSVNIPAVKILNELGTERGARYLEKLNLKVDPSDYSLALALGGMKEGFTPIHLLDAYSVFPNGGMFAPSKTISSILDGNGKELYSYRPHKTSVFSEDVCALINDMLSTTVQEGTAKKLKSLPFPVCAKTGTGEGAQGNLDAYTVSYTNDHTLLVWLGNRDNSPIHATGGGLPANLALNVYRRLYANSQPSPFFTSDSVCRVAYDEAEYQKNHRILLADPEAPPGETHSELFRSCNLPQEMSSRFCCPTIKMPTIYLKNNTVCIELCQTQYYDYVIKRENRGETVTIYSGKYQSCICDSSVRAGETYRYSVTPIYRGHEGETVYLAPIRPNIASTLPDDWWND